MGLIYVLDGSNIFIVNVLIHVVGGSDIYILWMGLIYIVDGMGLIYIVVGSDKLS
jgi:hypothetical protein